MTTRQQAETLQARLEAGWQKIDEAKADGQNVRTLEDFWLTLLGRYEQAVDQMEREREQRRLM